MSTNWALEFPELNLGQLNQLNRIMHEEVTEAFSDGFLEASIYHGVKIDDAMNALRVYGIIHGCDCHKEKV